MSGRAGPIVAHLVAGAVLVASSGAAAADMASEPGWRHALWIRSDALNRVHHLGNYRVDSALAGEPSWKRALRIRAEAMDRS
jgi:hypothetical protein